MFEKLIRQNKEILEIVNEISSYKQFEDRIKSDLKRLEKKYEKGEFTFEEYEKLRFKILKNHSKSETVGSYKSYILDLADKVEFLNTQIFLSILEDDPKKNIKKIHHSSLPTIKKIEDKIEEGKVDRIIAKIDNIDDTLAVQPDKISSKDLSENLDEEEKILPKEKEIESTLISKELDEKKHFSIKNIFLAIKGKALSIFSKENSVKTEIKKPTKLKDTKLTHKPKHEKNKVPEPLLLKPELGTAPEPIEKAIDDVDKSEKKTALDMLKEDKKSKENPMNLLKGRKLFTKNHKATLLEKFNEAEKPKSKQKLIGKDNVALGGILNIKLIRNIFKKIRKEDAIIRDKTSEAHSLLELKELLGDNVSEIPIDTSNFLTREATQIKKLLDQSNVNIYNPTSIGYLSNFFVRKITLNLIESYPNFFKNFYLVLRKANIKILSNTYVNIMFFLSLVFTLFIVGATILVSMIQKNPFSLIFAKAFVMSLITFCATAGAFYYYPSMKVGERLKSINTNLPFAIDQMSSVVSSGVPPATMFKLIAKTKEYGEVSVEIEKISNLIEVFGYDLVSSIRSVISTTPSKQLKEFFEGLVSTIETGGSLKNYLNQKSKEALLAYQTERQKYVESISTYSDIYTGLLIAAPLFFVSTLSLVSLLGGKVGGLEVSTVISLGTYIIIPGLNILFIIFLEVNQPQV